MIGKKINQLATELAPVSTDLTIIGDPISGVSKKITLAQLGAIFSGAVSFYTNFASFPATGTLDVIFCAKDTQKLYLWLGSAYVEVFPSQALLDTYQLRSEKGNANGYASLDSSGKVPVSQLPSSIMEYKGTWSAATNTPTLANGTGDTGDVYICNAAGSVNFGAGAITFAVGDYVIYSGSIWQRSSGAVGTVTSVAASITGNAIGITGSPVTTSGTLALAFAGTSAQYVNGAGNLTTFPSIISQAQNIVSEVYNNTGATLTKGTIVYINGGQGNLPTVTKALATSDSTSAQTYGIVQADITNMNNGYVVVAGRLIDLDTQAYSNGTQLYLSGTTAGTWTSTKPYAPIHLVYVGIVVRSHPTQGVVEVKIQNGYEMSEIHDVAAQTPTNNDGLFWEASTSLWKNKSIATVLGYTPQAQLNGTGFVKASGTTITYDNSTYLTTSAAATTYLPMVLSSTAKSIELNGQTFDVSSVAGSYTSGRLIVTPTFTAIGYQSSGVFKGLQIATDGTANFFNTGLTRFYNQVQFDSTLTNGTYTYTLPGATGTLALTSDLTGGTVTSVGLSSATSGVTIGSTPITTSGTITLAIATASGSQQGLLSSTDWTTFNNKQNALTNPVTGTGTTNYLPKFTGTSTIGNSIVQDSGSAITIGGAVNVTNGNINLSNAYYLSARNNANTTNISLIGRNTSDRVIIDADGYGTTIGGGGSIIINPTGGDLLIGTTTPLLSSTGRGNITINGSSSSILAFGIASALSGYIYSSSSNLELDAGGARFMQFNTNGNERMRISASGNLSIGNTNNTYKLDVSGQIVSNNPNGLNAVIWAKGGGDATGQGKGNFRSSDAGGTNYFDFGRDNLTTGNFVLTSGGGSPLLSIATSGAATFSNNGFFGGGSSTIATGYGSVDVNGSTGGGTVYSAGTAWKGRVYANSSLMSIETNGALPIMFYPNGTLSLTLASTGAATFSSSVTAGSTSSGANINAYSSSYGNNGLFQSFGTDGNLKLQMGGLGNSEAFFYTGGYMTFYTGGSEKVRITSGGLVGIGTTSPAYKLDLFDSSGSFMQLYQNDGTYNRRLIITSATTGGNAGITMNATSSTGGDNFIFQAASTERMRITSGGSFLVRSTSAAVYDDNTGGTVEGYWSSQFTAANATTKTLLGGAGSDQAIVGFSGVSSASKQVIIAGIYGVMTSSTAGAETGDLRFYTKPSGNVMSNSERMRIKSNGIINLSNVPSSSAGLSSGDIYKTVAGVLMIV